MRIDFIRHGEPVGGVRYRGQVDHPLSETGWAQMREAVAQVKLEKPWDAIVTSPLSRCADFAHELATELHCPVKIEQDLMEIGFGDWEDKTSEEVYALDPDAFHNFYRDPVAYPPPGAEPVADFCARVSGVLQTLEGRNPGQRILVVGHAGMIRASIRHVLDLPIERMFQLQIPYAGVVTVQWHERKGLPMLTSMNGGFQ
jgi:alpha-ribazole phosphatase/probable phosphoglycerate mutase